MQLTERQEFILKTVVELYIATARPVGSHAILAASGLTVSSATIRSEMALLEDLGYLRQLHTSGGRIPTDSGYRYYVERLMELNRLASSEEITIRHQFHQAHSEQQEWLKLAATIMAYRLHNVGLVTAPKAAEIRLRHLEVIAIQHTVALLIVVLQDGTVVQEMMTLEDPHSQEELSALADRLGAELRGKTAVQVAGTIECLPPTAREISAMIVHLLDRAQQGHLQVYHAGLGDLIQQPEFLGPRHGESLRMLNDRLRQMVDFLHRSYAVERLFSALSPTSDVHVMIGSDLGAEGLQDYSVVLGRYGRNVESSGVLGVVGPMRMEYPRAVALVRYMSHLMTDLVQAH